MRPLPTITNIKGLSTQKTIGLKWVIAAAFLGMLTACVEDNSNPDFSSVDGWNTIMLEASKTTLDEATYEDIAEQVYECKGKKLCVLVCHRPPGNPENKKNMELPLEATAAHLNHGGSHHNEKDYLGECVVSPGPIVDPGTDPVDPGTDPVDPGTGPVIPLWCVPYHEIDQDCDGLRDDTGSPIF